MRQSLAKKFKLSKPFVQAGQTICLSWAKHSFKLDKRMLFPGQTTGFPQAGMHAGFVEAGLIRPPSSVRTSFSVRTVSSDGLLPDSS